MGHLRWDRVNGVDRVVNRFTFGGIPLIRVLESPQNLLVHIYGEHTIVVGCCKVYHLKPRVWGASRKCADDTSKGSGGIGRNSRVASPCGNLDVACAKNLPLHIPMV